MRVGRDWRNDQINHWFAWYPVKSWRTGKILWLEVVEVSWWIGGFEYDECE